MRKNIVAGNWKMNTTLEEGIALASAVNAFMKTKDACCSSLGVVIAPPFTHLSEINKVIDPAKVCLAAQNCSSEEKGAFTGEISPAMLKNVGVRAVILGHSERRAYYKEDNAILNKKVKLVLKHELKPIFCIGELLSEREQNIHFDVIKSQLEEGIFDLSAEDFSKVIIAYEPVWAIGTGVTASPAQAQEIHAYIRQLIVAKYNKEIADSTTILYGGSCNAANAKELFSNPDVDGGLIGGAALKAEDFGKIIDAI
jgi:triosephosphate isomerase (TIM)